MIREVQYVEMNNQLPGILEVCTGFGNNLALVSNELNTITNHWQGDRCAAFMKIWNEKVEAFKFYAYLLETGLPQFLKETVINKYAELDENLEFVKGAIEITQNGQSIQKFENVDPGGNTVKFEIELMGEEKAKLWDAFEKCYTSLTDIETKVSALPWNSSARDDFNGMLAGVLQAAKEAIGQTQKAMITDIENAIEQAENAVSNGANA